MVIKAKNKSDYCLGSPVSVSTIDSGISSAVRDSSKLSMTKVLRKKDTGLKRNSTDLWSKNGYFSSQVCNLFLEKANLPEMTIFYISQAYLSYKDNKKIYYTNVYILGQVVPLLNTPEDLSNYELKSDELKIIKPKYDPVCGQCLGLTELLGYITVHGD